MDCSSSHRIFHQVVRNESKQNYCITHPTPDQNTPVALRRQGSLAPVHHCSPCMPPGDQGRGSRGLSRPLAWNPCSSRGETRCLPLPATRKTFSDITMCPTILSAMHARHGGEMVEPTCEGVLFTSSCELPEKIQRQRRLCLHKLLAG